VPQLFYSHLAGQREGNGEAGGNATNTFFNGNPSRAPWGPSERLDGQSGRGAGCSVVATSACLGGWNAHHGTDLTADMWWSKRCRARRERTEIKWVQSVRFTSFVASRLLKIHTTPRRLT
jgi:hypothetical protein